MRLKEIAIFTSGTTPSRGEQERYFDNGLYHWVKTTDLNNGILNSTEEKITELALEETSLKILPKGTVVVAMYGGYRQIGRTGLFGFKGCINQALTALVCKRRVNPKYLLYWLNGKVHIWKRYAASSRKDPNITKTDIKAFQAALPPLPEQHRIAHCLTTWDRAITTTRHLLDALRTRKRGLMQRLLTGEVRLPGFSENWSFSNFGKYFSERKETGFDDLQLLSIGQEGVYPQEQSNKKDTSNKNKSKYKRICPNDIGYNTMRMWQGRSALSETEGIVSPAYTILKPKKNANPEFFSYLFRAKPIVHKFFQYSQGLVSDTWQCRYKDFVKIRAGIPPLKEQTAIANVLTTADREIALYEQKLETLETQKRGLMQQLLTGQKRLPA